VYTSTISRIDLRELLDEFVRFDSDFLGLIADSEVLRV
jgi:hypothetical protein